MMRKYLFWGLTLVLVAAMIILIIRGRNLEKQEMNQVVEIIKESKSSATRVWAPRDIKIVQAKMQLVQAAGKVNLISAKNEIEIRNNGKTTYSGIQLSLAYLDGKAKVLTTRLHAVEQTIPPGADLKLSDIKMEDLPASVTDCRASITYAEIVAEPHKQNG